MVKIGGSVSMNVMHQTLTAKCRKITSYLKRPASKGMANKILRQLKKEITSLPNWHRYPNPNRQLLNSISIKSTKANTFTVSVNPVDEQGFHYGFIIEKGRQAINSPVTFQGYYPNMKKLSSLMMKGLEATSIDRLMQSEGANPNYYRGALTRKKNELKGKLAAWESNIKNYGSIHGARPSQSGVSFSSVKKPTSVTSDTDKNSPKVGDTVIDNTFASTGNKQIISIDPITGARQYKKLPRGVTKASVEEPEKEKKVRPVMPEGIDSQEGIVVRSELISEIIKKYPTAIDRNILDALNDQSSDLYTIHASGVKAAYNGLAPHVMTNMRDWVAETWKKDFKTRIRNYEYELDT
jgi:hypothetical protein